MARNIANNLRGFLDEFRSEKRIRYLIIAQDFIALWKSRWINDRVDAQGQSIGEYAESTQKQKARQGRDTDSANTVLFDSGFGGFSYPAINLYDSGQMMNSVESSIVSESDTETVILITPTGTRQEQLSNQELMQILEDKYGIIMEVSELEDAFLIESAIEYANELFAKYNLAA